MDSKRLTRKKVMHAVLDEVDEDLGDEQAIHDLLDSSIAHDTSKSASSSYGLGERLADKVTRFAGSWKFIISFTGVLIAWMVVNTVLAANAFDAFPFILLNLVLSCIAALQSPFIMMSQNRQEEKDRLRSENDYKVNLKSEFVLRDLHKKMDHVLGEQKRIEQMLENMGGDTSDDTISAAGATPEGGQGDVGEG
jgi:uncharacterized membrane protein